MKTKKAKKSKGGKIAEAVQPGADVSLALSVVSYSARVHPLPSIIPQNYDGRSTGFMILTNPKQAPLQFNIAFLPDGTNFPGPGYDPVKSTVYMYVSWCQYAAPLHLLQSADSVQAPYSESARVIYADVEGQFTRK